MAKELRSQLVNKLPDKELLLFAEHLREITNEIDCVETLSIDARS